MTSSMCLNSSSQYFRGFCRKSLPEDSRHSNGYESCPSSCWYLSVFIRSGFHTIFALNGKETAYRFNLTYRYIDDVLSINNPEFENYLDQMHPADPWPVPVTSQLIRLSTNFMTLIPCLTFTELRVVSIEHLRRVWHASRECLPFRTPGSVPLFGGLAYAPIVETSFPELVVSFLDFSPWIPLGTFSIFPLQSVLHFSASLRFWISLLCRTQYLLSWHLSECRQKLYLLLPCISPDVCL